MLDRRLAFSEVVGLPKCTRGLLEAMLAEAGIEADVESIGDPYENAFAETIDGLYGRRI